MVTVSPVMVPVTWAVLINLFEQVGASKPDVHVLIVNNGRTPPRHQWTLSTLLAR
jgi:hypothetical protein